jgi:FSR family fosmidomycin resistance protein-like MFS transporter
LVLIYNVLAFGTQPLFGRLTDLLKTPRWSAAIGCIVTAASIFGLRFSPMAAVLLAGVGNALFHVGGGTISLNLTPQRATAPGLFVAPGALGLAAGIAIGKAGLFVPWPFVSLLLICCIGMWMVKIPSIDYQRKSVPMAFTFFGVMVLLLLVSISIRTLVGFSVAFPWKADSTLLATLVVAVFFGKAAGGILADRYGWLLVAVSALLISAPLIAFGANMPGVAIVGVFLFNLTMAVTLAAVAGAFPGRPGFAFGITCIFYLAGGLLAFTYGKDFLSNPWIVTLVILCSAAALFGGLRMFSNYRGLLESRPS